MRGKIRALGGVAVDILRKDEPCDDLAGHFVSRVCEVSRKTEIGNLELPVGSDEQVVWLQIL